MTLCGGEREGGGKKTRIHQLKTAGNWKGPGTVKQRSSVGVEGQEKNQVEKKEGVGGRGEKDFKINDALTPLGPTLKGE